MRRFILISAALLMFISCAEKPSWAPVEGHISTRWAAEVTPDNVHPEYPRPQMVRPDWMNLNGLWEYAITKAENTDFSAEGHILVPFAVESSLSGVGRQLTPDDALWYRREFKLPSKWSGKKVLLHFGAVDWQAEVWVNGTKLKTHTGGYTSFSYDITPYLKAGKQELVVKVIDRTDDDFQPRGKQKLQTARIWYTAVSGIWQTVWLEPVSKQNIADYNTEYDIFGSILRVSVDLDNASDADQVRVEVLKGEKAYSTQNPSNKVIASSIGDPGQIQLLEIPSPELWSSDNPYLYGLRITLLHSGKTVDQVQGYTALRTATPILDSQGYRRIAINRKPVFQMGTLDQGWWPDGLYTAPTDEAMRYDIEMTLKYGFNMIRKHMKVEPATWYYACDQLGVAVWQDMPAFANKRLNVWNSTAYDEGTDFPATEEAKKNFYKEWAEIIDQFEKFKCIVMWVPFNEAWGQFDTGQTAEYTYYKDNARLVNMASGGNWISGGIGDMLDVHNYPVPIQKFYDIDKINVVGEYGGMAMPLAGHLWTPDNPAASSEIDTSIADTFCAYAELIISQIYNQGTSAAVYTQITDVEDELNGLMTYDREICKLDIDQVASANRDVIEALEDN